MIKKQTFPPLVEKIGRYEEQKKRRRLRWLSFLGMGALLVVIISAGWYLLKSWQSRLLVVKRSPLVSSSSEASAPTNAVVEVPASPVVPEAPKEAFDRSALKVQVLNGSGKAGVAADLAKRLKALGYKGIKTGDAAAANYTVLNLAVRGGEEKLKSFVTEDLAKVYPEVPIDALDNLPEKGDFDVLIIVGKF